MFTDHNNSNNDIDEEGKVYFYSININKKQWASKLSTSPKEKLELGKVLKVEIGEIRVIVPLV